MDKLAVGRAVVVVCIVMAVAALMAAPVADATKTSARQICQDNLRMIWRAMKAYQEDYLQYPPIDRPGGVGWDGGIKLNPWGEMLIPYGVSVETLKCPCQDLVTEKWARKIWGFEEYLYGYAINTNLCADNPLSGLRATAPVDWDRLLLVGDGYFSWFAYDDSEDPNGRNPFTPSWWSNKIAWRHPKPVPYSSTNAGTNFLTASGQAVYVKKFINRSQYRFPYPYPNPGSAASATEPADVPREVLEP
jgi:hypothetical protein